MTGNLSELVIGIKSAGEMASGIAWRLFQSGFKKIFMMEIPKPLAVRRQVSFCEALYDGSFYVEGVEARAAESNDDFEAIWGKNAIAVLVDPLWEAALKCYPHVMIDAIIAKKNLGSHMDEAPLVIGLGPGFNAGENVHMVIETNRGHNLGKIILNGPAAKNTGAPGDIGGFTRERVLRTPCNGEFTSSLDIGAIVHKNDVIGQVNHRMIKAQIDGVLRGLIRNNTHVSGGLKIGDIDPRGRKEYCSTISEKARAVGGSVLEAILRKYNC